MIEIMFQGQGGHGSVVAAKLLAQAAAESGFHAQSFASYGALRRGGKVEGYVRISEKSIPLRCKMYVSDYLIIMDGSLLDEETTPRILKEKGEILINTPKAGDEFPFLDPFDVFTVDAFRIALGKGLVIPGGMPVINTTLLGALVGRLKKVPLEHLLEVIRKNTPKPDKNAECAMEGYRAVTSSPEETGGLRAKSEGKISDAIAIRQFPFHDPEKMKNCHRCQICYMVCPNVAVGFEGSPLRFSVNRAFCTSCGICIEECPRGAISWEGKEND